MTVIKHQPAEREVPLLMRATEALLLAAYDEAAVLATATNLLGERFGYSMRYVLLHDKVTDELYVAHAAGPGSERPDVRAYRGRVGQGLTGIAAQTRSVVNVPDVRKDPRYIAVVPECASEICIPMLVRSELIGVIVVESGERNAFSERDEELLLAFSQVTALALIHARADQRHRSDIAELQAVNEIARRATSLDLKDTLCAAADAFQRATTSDSTAIYLWDEPSQRLVLGTIVFDPRYYPPDYEERVREKPLQLGEGLVGWSAQQRRAVLIDDVAKDARVQPIRGIPLLSKAAIVIPLVVEDRLLGVIRAVKMGVGSYSPEHFRFAQTLANQIVLLLSAVMAHEEARRLAITDALTGLFNARYLQQRLGEEIQRAQRYGHELTLLIVDSDALKLVNDSQGHAAGNELLVQLARAIRQQVRATDLVARFGGDEFVIVQPETGSDTARATAERIRRAAYAAADAAGVERSVSVGVATYPHSALDADLLFQRADGALYQAKRAGKDRVVVAT